MFGWSACKREFNTFTPGSIITHLSASTFPCLSNLKLCSPPASRTCLACMPKVFNHFLSTLSSSPCKPISTVCLMRDSMWRGYLWRGPAGAPKKHNSLSPILRKLIQPCQLCIYCPIWRKSLMKPAHTTAPCTTGYPDGELWTSHAGTPS